MNKPSTCPHFALCSGCELKTDFFQPPIWNQALSFFNTAAPTITPILHTNGFNSTRFKAKLAVRAPSKIGLFKKGTHEVVPIPNCLVHHPAINQASALIQYELSRHPISLYSENPPSGHLRYIQLAVDPASNQIQLVLILNDSAPSPEIITFCNSLLKHGTWHSIWLNFHPDSNNRILGDAWQLIHGDPFLIHTLNGTQIALHPGAFSQANMPLFETLIQKIETWIQPSQRILELFAGAGAIGLSLGHKASQIRLIENNPYAHLSFQESLKFLPPSQRTLFSYECIDANTASLSNTDLIIVDPPRKGLEPPLLEKLIAAQPARLIYVSCGFESFQRDALRLLSSNYRISDLAGYLFFPGTNHVETLTLFEKLN